MKYTKLEEKMRYLRVRLCACKSPSKDPKDHEAWCPFSVWKSLKPQPKKEQVKPESEN